MSTAALAPTDIDLPFRTADSAETEDRLAAFLHLPDEERPCAFEQLIRDVRPGARGQVLWVGARVLPDELLTSFVRDPADDVRRNAGLEMLKLRGARGAAQARLLLGDPDPDVVLQAVLVLGTARRPEDLDALCEVLTHHDANVVQAAIAAVGALGATLEPRRAAEVARELMRFLDDEPWLCIAAIEALGTLRSTATLPPLVALLDDELLGPFAAEAVARIGGFMAFRHLARRWLRERHDDTAAALLGLATSVLEDLPRQPAPIAELRERLTACLDSFELAPIAARCLLALGAGPEDEEALTCLTADGDPLRLPPCMHRRIDLIAPLLSATGPDHAVRRAWGAALGTRAPRALSSSALRAVLADPAGVPRSVIEQLLKRIRHPDVAIALLDLYLASTPEERGALVPLLRTHRGPARAALRTRTDIDDDARLVLEALLGDQPDRIARAVTVLPIGRRLQVIEHLKDLRAVMRRLPWAEWLSQAPERFGPAAAHAAVLLELTSLTPALRTALGRAPAPELVRVLGILRDYASVPTLEAIIATRDPALRLLAIESLGQIGGARARRVLRAETRDADAFVARMAYRALSMCASPEDRALFVEAAASSDWYVRLSAAGAHGIAADPAYRATLERLAVDPVVIVAERARAVLDVAYGSA